MIFGHPSVNEILQGQIYLGNLPAALSPEVQKKLGTTHIVSVCPEYASTGPHHLSVAVEDSEYENILIHLPGACQFIQTALDHGGRVFVHCAMGVSRSATVVAAYQRPQVHPNYGFIKQLETFADCQYNPSPSNPVYCKWKRQQKRNVTQFLNQMIDTTPIVPNELLLSSEFPTDPWQAESLILDAGITHLLSLSPAHQIPHTASTLLRKHRHINIKVSEHTSRRDGLGLGLGMLHGLREACEFIQDAVEGGGQVLVHCAKESRACVVVCAFLMYARNLPPEEALAIIEDALPLFNPTKSFFRHLELFDACRNYTPTPTPTAEDEKENEIENGKQLVQRWGASVVSPNLTVEAIAVDVDVVSSETSTGTGLDVKARLLKRR